MAVMKQLFGFAALLLLIGKGYAQTFNGTGGTIPPTAPTTGSIYTCFPATVSGVGTINSSYGLSQVCMTITHNVTEDLEILLRAPDGTYVPLSIQNGTGANFSSTCFTATATNPVKFASNPFNGTYLPEGHLGAVNNGQNANGTWSLCIVDRRNGATSGSVVNWSLTFSNTPAPQPPAIPACSTNIPSTSDCASASPICDFNGACGSTTATTKKSWTALDNASCFGLNNNTFVKFVAASTTVSFSVWVTSSGNGFNNINGGIQMLFFSTPNCGGPVTTYGCYNRIYPYPSAGSPLISVIYASGLTVGNTYYLLMDGANGDLCNFTIAANSGVNILNVTPSAPQICTGQSVNLTATGGNGVYSWSPATNLNTTSGATVTANPTATTTYTINSSTALGCPTTKNVTVTVNPLPAAPAASITAQPSCTTPTGTITVTAPTGAGLEYSLDGTTYQSNTTFTNLTPGLYNVRVRNSSTGCVSNTTSLTVNNPPTAPAAPTASVTVQPTCTVPTGAIVITAPVGANLEYSINGSTFQSGTTFTGITPGTYTLLVRNTSTGCTSAGTSITVNNAPAAPAAPTASVTVQPTCTVPTGTVVITAPTGASLEYSINGTNYQGSTTFNGVAPGTYNLTVRNTTTGCISGATSITVNGAPSAPAAPTASVTVQPSCTVGTGTIVISAPTGANLEYSLNGTSYQAGTTFTTVAPGTYNVTVRNTASGCVSAATSVTVNAAPSIPAAPAATATQQPTCTSTAGQISITAPTGASFEYSINGTSYQTGTIFNNVAPGTYNVTVRNTVSGCISPASQVVINNAPATPTVPTASVTVQPTCTVTTGTIVIAAPTGTNLDYSINSINFQAGTTFAGVAPGTYNVVVRNNLSGCISNPASVTVNAVPAPPVAPTISVTAQPSCSVVTGSISVTAPLGTTLEYSLNGTNWQAAPVFSGLQPASYSLLVRNTASGCTSTATPFVINAVPAIPSAPVVSISTAATCVAPTATITITAPAGTNLAYGINGVYQTLPVFPGLQPGSAYVFTVRNNTSGCISLPVNQTIPALGCNDDLFVPNAFSPNGDGKNDVLFVRGTSIRSMRFLVYNQWGEKVFESNSPTIGWNGAFGGKQQPVGVYMYVLRAEMLDGAIINKKGSVTLVR
jgi:gliding motility-associated-like protein